MDNINLTETDLEALSPLVIDLRHEISSPLAVLKGNLSLEREGVETGFLEGADSQELEDFIEDSGYMISYLELMGTIPEQTLSEIRDYASRSDLPEGVTREVDRIASVSTDVYSYQQRLLDQPVDQSISVRDLLEPIEANNECFSENFNYNGYQDMEVSGDSGLGIIPWTLAKNHTEHASTTVDDLEIGFNVKKAGGKGVIDIWDNGEGLFRDYSDPQQKYEAGERLFSDDGEGHGLPMAREIADVYGAQINYSEQMIEDQGFGVKLVVPEYQNSTSESL